MSETVGSLLEKKKERNIWYVAPDATVYDAIELMAEKSVGALLVLAGSTLIGNVTERDYARKVILQARSSKETRAEEIMKLDLVTVTRFRIRHLPVLEIGESSSELSLSETW
jgi:CBS domain-containing protein